MLATFYQLRFASFLSQEKTKLNIKLPNFFGENWPEKILAGTWQQ
jgi:hypothetical protein